MFENFDELFNSLFNQRKRKNLESLNDFMKKLNINNEKNLDNLEPTTKRTYEKNGFTFEETVWENEHGRMVKVELIGSPFDLVNKNELSLEEKLSLAISEERYEDAAKIRDEINNIKQNMKYNNVVDEKDEWNF